VASSFFVEKWVQKRTKKHKKGQKGNENGQKVTKGNEKERKGTGFRETNLPLLPNTQNEGQVGASNKIIILL
jgi:hypothetical protein